LHRYVLPIHQLMLCCNSIKLPLIQFQLIAKQIRELQSE